MNACGGHIVERETTETVGLLRLCVGIIHGIITVFFYFFLFKQRDGVV